MLSQRVPRHACERSLSYGEAENEAGRPPELALRALVSRDRHHGPSHARVCRVPQAGAMVPWESLRDQFGQEYKRLKDFRKEFRDCLSEVCQQYRDAKLE